MASTPTPRDGGDAHPLEAQRRANRDAVAAAGLDPYGGRVDGVLPLRDAAERYDADADAAFAARDRAQETRDARPVVTVAGRVVLLRDNGKLVWMNLRDHSGELQIAVSQRDCDAQGFTVAKSADLGDIVVATGPLMRTRTGETTVWASSLRPAAKCLVPPPEKWSGLQDLELRYRQRYVDLWSSPAAMRTAVLRPRLVAALRRFLEGRGFLEVETPMLQPLAGGAAARPFVTHMNALDIDLFLRVAPELYLKRLLVGGLPRVFELGRNFRNEGLDRSHNPEFTSLEVYEAFGDCGTMMELTESLVRALAREAAEARDDADRERLVLPFGELAIDYGSPFVRAGYGELFERALGFSMQDESRARRAARERGIEEKGLDVALVVNELFERVAEPLIDPARPTFVVDYPAALSPLTRPRRDNPAIAERWDLFIGGMEIGPAYTELNDPDVQEQKFREQLAGLDAEEATFRTFDADFVRALKVGMPPAGGLGLGVDRLVMLLAGQPTIRDVIMFPLMRPEG